MDTPQTEPAQTEHILAEAETPVVYPPPPGMHWAALLAAQIGLAILTVIFFPKPWWNLISNMAVDAWMIYLCLWLRKLNPASMSLFFCAAYIALQLAFAVPTGPVPTAPAPTNFGITLLAATLALLAVLTWIVTIYVMRADLHYHYNLREPVGLYLNGILTFFFSYLYFQYHLRKIAQLRERYGDRPFYYQGGPQGRRISNSQ